MAFNFGAFVGGFSEQLVKDLEAEEERKFEMEKIAETEAMRQRAAASSRRREEQIATERMMGALSMFYGPEVASEIALRGQTAVDFAMDAGQRAAERGLDPNTLWRITTNTGDLSDANEQAAIDETLSVAQAPDAEITMGAATAPAPTITTGGFALDREAFAQLYGEPDEYANTYQAAITRLSQQQLRTTDENEWARLEAEKDALREDYREFEAAGRDPQEEKPFFTASSLPTNISAARKGAGNRYGFRTDLEGNILFMTEGNEHMAYIVELSAAQTLESQYGFTGDRALTNSIEDMRSQARNGLIEYGRRIAFEGGSDRLKPAESQQVFADGIVNGQYRIGDVITYTDNNGITRIAIYTGIPNDVGLPVIMGR